MELTKIEVAAIDEAVALATEIQVKELNELQLALVGGGIGDVVFG
jgi:hypothetical protein